MTISFLIYGACSAETHSSVWGAPERFVQFEDYYINAAQTAVMGKADLTLATGAKLRVADLFEGDEAGQITAQENHFDPRPALR